MDEKEAKIVFKELPFYNAVIGKPHIKCFYNIGMLRKLPFYDDLGIVKTSKAFKGYAKSYSLRIIDSKHLPVQLTIIKPSIKDLFKDLLKEIKAFKYQIILKLLLRKYKEDTDIICFCLFNFYY